jgi:hypothetical protein
LAKLAFSGGVLVMAIIATLAPQAEDPHDLRADADLQGLKTEGGEPLAFQMMGATLIAVRATVRGLVALLAWRVKQRSLGGDWRACSAPELLYASIST